MAPGWHRLSSEAIDEVGYLPFEQDAANLFFQLVSSRYEHASLILTSNLPFARWGDVFGDQTVAADMIDRILHHADVHTLKGSSYRLKHVTDDTLPSVRLSDQTNQKSNTWPNFQRASPAHYSTSVDRRSDRRSAPADLLTSPATSPTLTCTHQAKIGKGHGD